MTGNTTSTADLGRDVFSFVHRSSFTTVSYKKVSRTDDYESSYLYFNLHFSRISSLGVYNTFLLVPLWVLWVK